MIPARQSSHRSHAKAPSRPGRTRLLSLALLLPVLFSFALSAADLPRKETRLFVSTQGNDAWSGALPEPNADRSDGPLASLGRARDAVRTLVARTSMGGVFLHLGRDNLVEHNILVGDAQQRLFIRGNLGEQVGNRVRRNILVATDPGAKMVSISKTNFEALAEWQARGFDTHSLVADPLCVDPAADDYRPRPTSPAFQLGFQASGAARR